MLGRGDHVLEGSPSLGPLASLQTTVGVDPELLGLEVSQHLLDAVLNLLLGGNTGRVDVVDTGSDMAGVGLVLEDLQELSIGLGVLNGENIGVQSSDGVEEVLELGVTEMRVDLSVVGDTSSSKTERVHSPLEVCLTLGSRPQRKTFTKSRLVNLDDLHTASLEINNLVTESKSELLSLDGLVNVVTGK